MSGIKSIIFNEIIKYAQDDFSTAKDRKKLVDNIFSKLDTNKDMQLSDKDGMNDFYKRHFGIELSDKPITKNDLLETIDDIAVEMSFEDAPESDFSKDYVSPEEQKKIDKENKIKADNAYTSGSDLYNMLDGRTSAIDYEDINIILEDVNKDNVMKFLEGFYSHNDSEGIIEFLDDEWDGDTISMKAKMNIINSFLEYAKDKGYNDTIYHKRIERVLNNYNSENDKNFNTWHILDWTTDNEIIDDAMKNLYNKIKREEQEQN